MAAVDGEEFRPLLERERERIAHAIGYLNGDSPGTGAEELLRRTGENNPGDMAAVTFDREFDEGLEEGAQQTLAQIDRALARLDDGSFGLCERCGGPIGAERLAARPWASLCIDDQRLVDRG
jgi:RNA polymerase-binding protein DksA